MKERILFVYDENRSVPKLQQILEKVFAVDAFPNAEYALAAMRECGRYSAIVYSAFTPETPAIQFFRRARQIQPEAAAVLLTTSAAMEEATLAMQEGALTAIQLRPLRARALVRAVLSAIQQVRASSAAQTDEELAGFSTVAHTVIQGLRKAQQTAEQLQIFETIAMHVDEPVLAIELGKGLLSDRFVFANQAFTRLTQYSQSEILGACPTLVCSENGEGQAVRLMRASRTSKPVCWDMQALRRDGSPAWIETTCIPVFSGHDRQTHAIWIWREHHITLTSDSTTTQVQANSMRALNHRQVASMAGLEPEMSGAIEAGFVFSAAAAEYAAINRDRAVACLDDAEECYSMALEKLTKRSQLSGLQLEQVDVNLNELRYRLNVLGSLREQTQAFGA